MARTVLITGGTRGIGRASCAQFAACGWNVALCGRDGARAEAAAASIAQAASNPNVWGMGADVGDAQAVARLFDAVAGRFAGLDALVNNAAVLRVGGVFDLGDEAFEEMMRVNVSGVVHCSRLAFRRMGGRGGAIVNVSSLAGVAGVEKLPGLWGYTASKFAVVGLTEGLAVEGRPLGIRVNCIAPGAVDTDMLRQAAPGFTARAKPDDIARIAYFLCDPEQSGILTGATIPVYCNE